MVDFSPVTVGDVRNIVITVTPSDSATAYVQTATYTILERGVNVIVGQGTAQVSVSGNVSTITIPSYAFTQIGQFVIRYTLTWSDGIVDNTTSALINVLAPAS